jgi:methionine-rich copper-binding protein CopC
MMSRSASGAAALIAMLGAALLLGVPAVHAAARLVSSSPTRYAALIHPPRLIRLRFSEALVSKSSSVKLTAVSGRPVRVAPVTSRDDSTLEVRIRARLDPGVYMVHWTLVSAVDGSRSAGEYQFTVQ